MATFIEIDSTIKTGFVRVTLNNLAPINNIKEYYLRISSIDNVGLSSNELFVEIKLTPNYSLFVTFNQQQTTYPIIESVNGVVVTDNIDLYNKLIAILT